MNDITTSPTVALQRDLLDIQHNLNDLIRQLNRPQPGKYYPQGAAALMAAMGYKLTQLSQRVYH